MGILSTARKITYTATQLKNQFKNLKSAPAIDRKIDRLIAKDNVENSDSQIIAAGNSASKSLEGPKPIFRAEKKVSKKVTDKLKEQDAVVKESNKAKKARKKPKGAPVEEGRKPRSPAVDKPEPAKKDTRVASAGVHLTSANKKAIKDAPTTISLTSLENKISKEISALKTITSAEKKARRANLADAISSRKAEIRKVAADAAKPKKPDTRHVDKTPQSARERALKGYDNVSAIVTTQRNKKEGVGMMRSYLSMERGAAIEKAGRDLRADKITQETYKEILAAIRRKNAGEVNVQSRNAAQKNRDRAQFKGYTPKSPFNKGGLARVGHTDMRKGGLFK